MTEFTQIGRYKIIKLLGSGTFADVYHAVDTELQRPVAIKVLKAVYHGNQEVFNRFRAEALSAANLDHPNIAWLWETGDYERRLYLVIRYIEGQSLDKVVRENGQLPWPLAFKYTTQIGEALGYAHARNYIHRDIKPQNIIISVSQEAVLTDFGLVKAIESSGLQTASGAIVGTPQYVPAEVWNGEPVTKAVDQYALGCVLAEMLTGRILFQASTVHGIIKKHLDGPDRAWYPLPRTVPGGVEEIIRKALSPTPLGRFPDIGEFLKALKECARNAITSEPLTQQRSSDGMKEPPGRVHGVETPTDPGSVRKSSNALDLWKTLSEKKPGLPSKSGHCRLAMPVAGGKSQIFRLTKKETTLGRQPDCDIKFNDLEVSRHHARIHLAHGVAMLEDLESVNGTFVNNQRVTGKVELKHGDRIRLGKMVEMVFEDT